ncbi:LLM class flavin-dependent oxidoreductase [Mumia zhuanghuii]|uniref:LLM class flavin-dependent oxidoreductase n=1 Tax=Mumia zhuanghuii TaxID=2585211 RepID=A0A5C4MQG4_9ACTN|nr:LLM class flavin-dependent oxidoreductase [Mumia zhuanghuii]TNC38348.1 LLM class flavin-dependent oxidoreductase [Mumia zhuanghuii]TNC45974.1 LLM class flavin-dependent oxidoreductase [Mumia zhuanghuii]
MTSLGVVYRPQLPPERLRPIARAADEAGLDELWLWEDCFLESGIATASAALAWTERLHVGVGLLPVPLRNVALTAMEVATLHRLFPGRVTVGIGHGLQEWMGQAGARVESPVTLLREYATALRALLRGERVSTQGRYVRLDDVALEWPPLAPVPVLAGAVGPRSLRLTGEVADGTVIDARVTPEGLRAALDLVSEGRRESGRTGAWPVVVYVLAATGPGARDRVAAEAERSGPAFQGVGAAGAAEEIAGVVRGLAVAGATTVVLQPTADEPDPEGFVRFAAEQVRPLVPR